MDGCFGLVGLVSMAKLTRYHLCTDDMYVQRSDPCEILGDLNASDLFCIMSSFTSKKY